MGRMMIEVIEDPSAFCEKSRSLDGFEGGLSTVLAMAAKQLLPAYKKEVVLYDEDLQNVGRLAVRKAFKLASKDAKPEKSGAPMPAWVAGYVDPIVDPIMKGVADESARLWVPLVIGGGLFLVSMPVFFFWLGRKSKRT